ncbi:MAG: hypothetical protein CMJ24_08785 [Phycisphaerae bacterium]|nr:hypothetical protein [Phycisphaerae bacterium]|tara:strand:+ start:1709 stop:2842 length:1134 start_codon:yes stop_codon:yes gene_type:complete
MSSLFKTIGWGLFCTSSWTWCIGMWLPLLLIDRWGWPGFWLFAIPNVLGCAAMGYIVGSRERSEHLVRRHRGAMRWFSCITIAFQLFWITALSGTLDFKTLMGSTIATIVVPLAVLLLGTLVATLPRTGWLLTGAALFVWSMTCFGILGTDSMRQIESTGTISSIELWGAAPIIVLGFLLSPYLDLTFHRARQETPSSHSFAVFGISFMAILLFVASYWPIEHPDPFGILMVFWVLQLIFTIGAHIRELRATDDPAPGRWGSSRSLVRVARIPISLVWIVYFTAGLGIAEVWLLNDTYLRFLGFYGLAVPVWVLAFMWPIPAARTRPVFILLGAALLIAFILAELGMVQTPTWWLLPAAGLAIVVPLATARRWPAAA